MFLSEKAEYLFTEFDKAKILGMLAYCYFEHKPMNCGLYNANDDKIVTFVYVEDTRDAIKIRIYDYPDIVYAGKYFFIQNMVDIATDILNHAAETYKEEV